MSVVNEMANKFPTQMARESLHPGVKWLDTIMPRDSRMDIRKKILQLEVDLRHVVSEFGIETIANYPLVHRFADGCYIREITIPAGQFVIGKVHLHKHLNFITRGSVICVTEGKGVEVLQGPCTIISDAGTKRVLYTYEETVWTTVHVTNAKTVEEAERDSVVDTYEEAAELMQPKLNVIAVQEEACHS